MILLDEVPGTSYEDYESVDVTEKIKKITGGEGVKCVIDGIGKATVDISIDSLARRGIFVSFGNASGAVPPISLLSLTPKSAYVTRPKLGDYVATKEELQSRAKEVFGYVASGKLSVTVDSTLPLKDATAGHMYVEAGQSKGTDQKRTQTHKVEPQHSG